MNLFVKLSCIFYAAVLWDTIAILMFRVEIAEYPLVSCPTLCILIAVACSV